MEQGNGPDTDLGEEEKIRALVREMFSTPEGTALMEAFFGPHETTKAEQEEAVAAYLRMQARESA